MYLLMLLQTAMTDQAYKAGSPLPET